MDFDFWPLKQAFVERMLLERVFAGIGGWYELELSELMCGNKAKCRYDAAEVLEIDSEGGK